MCTGTAQSVMKTKPECDFLAFIDPFYEQLFSFFLPFLSPSLPAIWLGLSKWPLGKTLGAGMYPSLYKEE